SARGCGQVRKWLWASPQEVVDKSAMVVGKSAEVVAMSAEVMAQSAKVVGKSTDVGKTAEVAENSAEVVGQVRRGCGASPQRLWGKSAEVVGQVRRGCGASPQRFGSSEERSAKDIDERRNTHMARPALLPVLCVKTMPRFLPARQMASKIRFYVEESRCVDKLR
ncbi:hypothetical protein BaRGS_00008064, partial [Batillaria attramentaria]